MPETKTAPERRFVDNPAGRLVLFMQEVRAEIPKIPGNQNPQIEQVLCTLWKIRKTDRDILLSTLACLIGLPKQVRESFSRLDDVTAELALWWLPQVERSFTSLHLASGLRELVAHYDNGVLNGAVVCADILSRRLAEKVLPAEEVDSLTSEVASLKARILRSDLELALKRFALEQLDAVERALREYRFTGTVPLERALYSAVGAAVAQQDVNTKLSETESGKELWQFFGRINIILGITWAALQIGTRAGDWYVALNAPAEAQIVGSAKNVCSKP